MNKVAVIQKTKPAWQWLRRLICIFGGGATAYVAVFVEGVLGHRPLHEVMMLWAPVGAVFGCVIGAIIVCRAETLEKAAKANRR